MNILEFSNYSRNSIWDCKFREYISFINQLRKIMATAVFSITFQSEVSGVVSITTTTSIHL